MTNETDTIAAVATAAGEAGISIVRISGPDSVAIADEVFHCAGPKLSEREGRAFVKGTVRQPGEGERDVDEVIALIYRAPHSYTREDVVEIQGHGGRASARRVLETVLACGARLAEPGEFTKRAFLNGRIDLVQAEAVADLIGAHSDRAAAAAVEQLEGGLSSVVTGVYDNLLRVAADLEATLDFDEGELPEATEKDIHGRLEAVLGDCDALLATWGEGHVLREGALVVISGKSNVGKSTLMNALLKSDRAIVTNTPGTTRDTIEEEIVLEGLPMRLVDTAGIRDTDCDIEREGVERALAVQNRADIVVLVLDCSKELENEDLEALQSLSEKRAVVVMNKADLGRIVAPEAVLPHSGVVCSLVTGEGLDDVRRALVSRLGVITSPEPHAVISTRHRQIIQNALNALNDSMALIKEGRGEMIVPAADLLRKALDDLGRITGRTYTKEVLDEIFSRFCVGK